MPGRIRSIVVLVAGLMVATVIAVVAIARTGGQKPPPNPPTVSHASTSNTTPHARRRPAFFNATWVFSHQLPEGWASDSGLPTLSFTPNAVRVVTGGGRYAYQLLSPVETLPGGSYEVAVSGHIEEGGLGIGVQDAAGKTWLAYRGYAGSAGGPPTVTASLAKTSRVRVILTNFIRGSGPSTWSIGHVTLKPSLLPAQTVFGSVLPAGWSLAGGATVSPTGAHLRIVTGSAPYRYAVVSPSGYIAAGRHRVSVTAHVVAGGIGLGLLDVRRNKWIAFQNFSSNSTSQREQLKADLPEAAMVQVILANNGDKVLRHSEWDLASVSVQ